MAEWRETVRGACCSPHLLTSILSLEILGRLQQHRYVHRHLASPPLRRHFERFFSTLEVLAGPSGTWNSSSPSVSLCIQYSISSCGDLTGPAVLNWVRSISFHNGRRLVVKLGRVDRTLIWSNCVRCFVGPVC